MKKQEQIRAMSEASGITYRQAERAYESLVEMARRSVSTGGRFRLVGIGTLAAKLYPKRRGFNPRTKTPIVIPEHRSVVFSPATGLKMSVR